MAASLRPRQSRAGQPGSGHSPSARCQRHCRSPANTNKSCKILYGHENIEPNISFKIKSGKRTRGRYFTLAKGQSRLDVRKYSFSQKTVNERNRLSADSVHSISINMNRQLSRKCRPLILIRMDNGFLVRSHLSCCLDCNLVKHIPHLTCVSLIGALLGTVVMLAMMFQGCPIGIPKNPEILGGSCRKKFTRHTRNTASLESGMGSGGRVVTEKSSLGTRETPRVSKV